MSLGWKDVMPFKNLVQKSLSYTLAMHTTVLVNNKAYDCFTIVDLSAIFTFLNYM